MRNVKNFIFFSIATFFCVLLVGCLRDFAIPNTDLVSYNGITIHVPEDFATIAAAIEAAQPGNTIILNTGIHLETGTIIIDKDLVITSNFIISKNQSDIVNTVIYGDGFNDLFTVKNGATVHIEGLTIEDTRKPITIDVGQGIIRNNILRNNKADSISFEEESNGVVEFNKIINSGDDGIDIDGLLGPYKIRGNLILGSFDDGMEFRMISRYLTNETISYEVYDNIIDRAGGDGIQLIDYPADDLNLRYINIHHNYIKHAVFAGIGTMPNRASDRTNLAEIYPNVSFIERVLVINNTIVDNDNGISGGDNFIVLNNIISNNRLGVTNLDGSSRLDYTMFFNNQIYNTPSVVRGDNIIFDDPMLNSIGMFKYFSPAVDSGVVSYSWQGLNVLNIKNFNGQGPDLGWIESNQQ
jgi:hypothetical protein